jgi:endonuclease/exonuclease/phosphatase family metal-dependent hydrolase
MSDRVRVATLNVWADNGDSEARRRVLVEGFRKLRPDLVALQETVVRDDYDQAREILGDEFTLVHQDRRHCPDGVGVSIASRWPVRQVRELDQHVTSRVGEFPATTLVAEIDAPAVGRVLFVNHFPSYEPALEREREVQAVAAVRLIDELTRDHAAHVILAGDLDAAPESSSIRFFRGLQPLEGTSVMFFDAWGETHRDEDGDTFTTRNPLVTSSWWPFRRIDYIFVRCDDRGRLSLRVTESSRIFDQPSDGVWASDHFGVRADLEPLE